MESTHKGAAFMDPAEIRLHLLNLKHIDLNRSSPPEDPDHNLQLALFGVHLFDGTGEGLERSLDNLNLLTDRE